MITKFKIYEKLNVNEPEVGDYVICYNYETDDVLFRDKFTSNNIGKLMEIQNLNHYNEIEYSYMVKYDFLPDELDWLNFKDLGKYVLSFYKNDIKYWSKNREDLEMILQTNKFNI